MPVERHAISRSQLCELLALDPARFITLERDIDKHRDPHRWWIVLEPEDVMQTTGTMPQLTSGKKTKGKKTVGGRSC